MSQEEKELLLKDLCARLPYGVQYKNAYGYKETLVIWSPRFHTALNSILCDGNPSLYLRPMSSMTEEEKKEYNLLTPIVEVVFPCDAYPLIDWLNKKMFDYRGLIPRSLALEAQEGMYK